LNQHVREIVDLDNTTAFCLGGMAGLLYIHDDNKSLADKIIKELLASFGPNSPEPLISAVEPAENIYQISSMCHSSPDYVISLLPGVVNHIEPNGPIVTTGDYEGKQTGTHAQDGIYVIAGPGTKKGARIDASIVDIAPTILSKIQIPVPDYMDGKVLQDAFKSSLKTTYIHKNINKFSNEKEVCSEEQQSEVEKQLRDLGYL
jgi:predicted AlkP superfamily phosphohydrolase/phosphomutase